MVMPGATMRNESLNRASCGASSLLSACQAMSIAMTTVLPLPVAILKAMRSRPGFAPSLASRSRVSRYGLPNLGAYSVRKIGRLDGLDLAEEEPPVTLGIAPVLQQPARRARNARIVALAPVRDGAAHLVDVVVLAQPIVGPLRAELELLALLLGLRDGDEVGARAARLDDLAGDPVVVELEVAARLGEGRVDHRILDDDFAQSSPLVHASLVLSAPTRSLQNGGKRMKIADFASATQRHPQTPCRRSSCESAP